MKLRKHIRTIAAGGGAGIVNGLFGAGGGMVLVPLLALEKDIEDTSVFPSSIAIILPICLVSLVSTGITSGLDLITSLPYLIGSTAGGILSGKFGRKIPVLWLHRGLGLMILWGGVRYLC